MDKDMDMEHNRVVLMVASKVLPGPGDLSTYFYELHKKKVLRWRNQVLWRWKLR